MARSEERYGRKVVLNVPRRNVRSAGRVRPRSIRDRWDGEVEGGANQPRVPGGGQRGEIDLVVSLLSIVAVAGRRATAHQDGPWPARRTPVQLQVTAV